MSEAAEFFLGSGPDVARYECLAISHPNFSQTYRIVRNAPAGLVVNHDGDPIITWIFGGTGQIVDFGNVRAFERTDAWSVSGEFNTTNTSGSRLIAKSETSGSFRGWAVLFGSGGGPAGSLYFRVANTPTTNELQVRTTRTDLNDGQDHSFLITYDGSSDVSGVTIYIDGVSEALTTVRNTLSGTVVTAEPLTLGGVFAHYAGRMHNIAIWDGELTASDATEIHGGGTTPDLTTVAAAADLLDWWKMDENDTADPGGVIDHGPGGFDGTANFDPTVTTDAEFTYDYYPARVLPIASEDDLVQSLSITLGDVGEVIAAEIGNIWDANGLDTRPTLTYRAYRSDDLSVPIEGSERVLEIAAVSRSREGCSFEARAPELNASRTGELYTVERFPMLAGFL